MAGGRVGRGPARGTGWLLAMVGWDLALARGPGRLVGAAGWDWGLASGQKMGLIASWA